jgi:hypothetical protein
LADVINLPPRGGGFSLSMRSIVPTLKTYGKRELYFRVGKLQTTRIEGRNGKHDMVKYNTNQQPRCVWCCGNNHEDGAPDRCTGKRLGLKTRYFCRSCAVNLCGESRYNGVSCFVLWHEATVLNSPCVPAHESGIQVRRRHGNRDHRAIDDNTIDTNNIDNNVDLSDDDSSSTPMRTAIDKIVAEIADNQLVTPIVRNSIRGIAMVELDVPASTPPIRRSERRHSEISTNTSGTSNRGRPRSTSRERNTRAKVKRQNTRKT